MNNVVKAIFGDERSQDSMRKACVEVLQNRSSLGRDSAERLAAEMVASFALMRDASAGIKWVHVPGIDPVEDFKQYLTAWATKLREIQAQSLWKVTLMALEAGEDAGRQKP